MQDACDKGLDPDDFVEDMKKKGIRVAGIGHRIKSKVGSAPLSSNCSSTCGPGLTVSTSLCTLQCRKVQHTTFCNSNGRDTG